jgi:hypothetical protein
MKALDASVLHLAYSTDTSPTSSAAPHGRPTCKKSRLD